MWCIIPARVCVHIALWPQVVVIVRCLNLRVNNQLKLLHKQDRNVPVNNYLPRYLFVKHQIVLAEVVVWDVISVFIDIEVHLKLEEGGVLTCGWAQTKVVWTALVRIVPVQCQSISVWVVTASVAIPRAQPCRCAFAREAVRHIAAFHSSEFTTPRVLKPTKCQLVLVSWIERETSLNSFIKGIVSILPCPMLAVRLLCEFKLLILAYVLTLLFKV